MSWNSNPKNLRSSNYSKLISKYSIRIQGSTYKLNYHQNSILVWTQNVQTRSNSNSTKCELDPTLVVDDIMKNGKHWLQLQILWKWFQRRIWLNFAETFHRFSTLSLYIARRGQYPIASYTGSRKNWLVGWAILRDF